MQPGAGREKVTPISPCRDVACYVLSAAFKTKTSRLSLYGKWEFVHSPAFHASSFSGFICALMVFGNWNSRVQTMCRHRNVRRRVGYFQSSFRIDEHPCH